jgi:hypothetical protein
MMSATQTTTRSTSPVTVPPVSALTLALLEWVGDGPRCYGETMEAWRTGCPRFPIWEDALDDGLVRVEHTRGLPLDLTAVVLTDLGCATLAAHRR